MTVMNATSVPTTGGLVTIVVNGLPPSSQITFLTVKIGVVSCINVTLQNNNTLTCNITSGFGKNIHITLSFLTTTNVDNNVAFSYQSPVVDSVTSTPTSGGLVIINGFNFYTSPFQIKAYIGNLPCLNPTFITPHYNFSCILSTGGSGLSQNVFVSVGDVVVSRNKTIFNYFAPSISSVTPIPYDGGLAVITGVNFGSNANEIQVLVNNVACGNVMILMPNTQISCMIGAGTGYRNVNVTVNGQSNLLNNTINQLYSLNATDILVSKADEITTSGGLINIYGSGFGNNSTQIQISIGNVNCTPVDI